MAATATINVAPEPIRRAGTVRFFGSTTATIIMNRWTVLPIKKTNGRHNERTS